MRALKLLLSLVNLALMCTLAPIVYADEGAAKAANPLILQVSFDGTLANVNHGGKPLAPPLNYGDVNIIRGYLYPGGTWAANGCANDDCGVNIGGGPEYPSDVIGSITCTGNFTSDPFAAFAEIPPPFGQEVGLFFLNLTFGDGSNMLELRGRTLLGFDGSNPAPFSVLGGTGIFRRAIGEALEIMIRPNASGAFNFMVDLRKLRSVPLGALRKLVLGKEDRKAD